MSAWKFGRKKNKEKSSGISREYWMIYRGTGILAIVWFSSPPSPSLRRKVSLCSQSYSVSRVELTGGRWGRKGWGRSQTIRPRESLALHISFNIFWSTTRTITKFHDYTPIFPGICYSPLSLETAKAGSTCDTEGRKTKRELRRKFVFSENRGPLTKITPPELIYLKMLYSSTGHLRIHQYKNSLYNFRSWLCSKNGWQLSPAVGHQWSSLCD